MKRLILMSLCLLVLALDAVAGALPVSKMQNAVSGVTQAKMQSRGFAANDPRYNGTLAGVGAGIAAAATQAATVTALGVTAPAWATVAAGAAAAAAVGAAVYFAIDAGLKWLLKDGNSVQIGDNPESINTPGGLPPPMTIYCLNAACGVSEAAACMGQTKGSGTAGNLTWTSAYAFTNGRCNTIRYYSDGHTSEMFWGSATKYTSNRGYCPGINLVPANGVCPASNFPEPNSAPVKTISDAANDLTVPQKNTSLDPQIIADIANEFWKAAASAPGYNGLPYDATQPITSADAAAWQAANPGYWPNVGDFVAPQAAPSGGTAATPFTMPTSTKPVSSADPATQPNTGTNPSTEPLQNLGADPGIGAPSLEAIPTAQQILSPLMNLFPSLRNFVVPGLDAACPHWSFVVFNRQITLSDHCSLLESIRPTLYAAMAVAYALLALLIVLAA